MKLGTNNMNWVKIGTWRHSFYCELYLKKYKPNSALTRSLQRYLTSNDKKYFFIFDQTKNLILPKLTVIQFLISGKINIYIYI